MAYVYRLIIMLKNFTTNLNNANYNDYLEKDEKDQLDVIINTLVI